MYVSGSVVSKTNKISSLINLTDSSKRRIRSARFSLLSTDLRLLGSSGQGGEEEKQQYKFLHVIAMPCYTALSLILLKQP